MGFMSSSYDEPGWDTSANEYSQAIKDITEHIRELKTYYAVGSMCSMSESVIGESVCDDILGYLEELSKRR